MSVGNGRGNRRKSLREPDSSTGTHYNSLPAVASFMTWEQKT